MPVSGKEPPILKGLPVETDGFGAWLKTELAITIVTNNTMEQTLTPFWIFMLPPLSVTVFSQTIATALTHAPLARSTLIGKTATLKPNGRPIFSRLARFSMWQYSFSLPT
jgi:hypothetical protein